MVVVVKRQLWPKVEVNKQLNDYTIQHSFSIVDCNNNGWRNVYDINVKREALPP